MISRLRPVSLGGALAALLVLGACGPSSGDFRSAAEDAIEGEAADQSGLGELSSTCEEPDDPGPGDVFACTATTEDGRTVEFTATVEADEQINVESTNLITVEGMGKIEDVAFDVLEENIGQSLDPENFACGSGPMIIDFTEEPVICALTDPATGEVYDAQVDIPSLEGLFSLTVQVADAPRG